MIIVFIAFIAMFFAIPLVSIVWCILNLIEYRKAKRESEVSPETHEEELKKIKIRLIISSVIALVLTSVVVGTIITFALGIVYM